MRSRMVAFLALLMIGLAGPSPVRGQDANEILKEVDANLTPSSFESYRKLINEEPDGSKKEFIFYSVKKGRDKMAMLYLAPASDRGRATLRLGDNMWLYIPRVGRPMRITSMQSVVGGVFNNADIMRLDYSAEYEAALLEETETGYVLDLKARSKSVAYDRLKMWVDKDPVIVTQVECYAASGTFIKTLEFKKVEDFGGGIKRPAVVETTSPLFKGYRSVMIYSGIELREFPDEVFTLGYMSRLEELR